MKIIKLEQNSPEWLSWRTGGYGSSDAAAILNESEFSTPYKVYLQRKGILKPFDGNAATQAGHEAESKARAEYEMAHGDFLLFEPICIEDEEYPILRASLDGYNSELKRIVEIKYPSEKSHEKARNKEIPRHYWIQIQYQLMICTEAVEAHYWSYRENDGQLVVVNRDEKFINEILKPGILAFDQMVKDNVAPKLNDDDAKWTDDEVVIDLINQYTLLKNNEKDFNEKDFKKERETIGEQIIKIAGHNKVFSKNGRVSAVSRNGIHSYFKFTLSKDSEL